MTETATSIHVELERNRETKDQNRVFEGYEFKRWIGGDR
jgi:hypothetical protein